MKKLVRLSERDLSRIVRRVIKEEEFNIDNDMMGSEEKINNDINKVMKFAYEMIADYAPDGPRNKKRYRDAIKQLKSDFNYSIRNLKGNIGDDSDDDDY